MVFSLRPVPTINVSSQSQGSMALGERVVQLQSIAGRRDCLRHDFSRLNQAESSKHRVAVGKPRKCQYVTSVNLYSLTEMLDALLISVTCALVPIESSFQVESMCFRVSGVAPG